MNGATLPYFALVGIPGFTGTPWITKMSKNILGDIIAQSVFCCIKQ